MVSGRQRDSQFARGFLSSLKAAGTQIVSTGDQMFRPVVTLEPPMGRAEGDVAIVISDDSLGATLVVIEREGSGPGNERNLLKWYAALRQHREIPLRRNGIDLEKEFGECLMVGDQNTGYIVVPYGTDLYNELVARCEQTGRTLAQWVRSFNWR